MRAVRTALCGALVATTLVLVAPGDPAAADGLEARGSVNQVQVTGATPGAVLVLEQDGVLVAEGVADAQGAYIFGNDPEATDDVPAGSGYTVTEEGSATVDVAAPDWGPAEAPSEVLGPDDHPPAAFYEAQDLPDPAYDTVLTPGPSDDDGFGYVTTRDGTTLAVNVLAPYLPTPGPKPVVINYSGYSPAAPGDSDPITLLFRVAGFTVVGVNMRGTGCSGGAYSFFEPLQGLDGYDVVEAVAAQDWVPTADENNAVGGPPGPMVGMVGISFPGISQLFVGRTNPPSLAAISPLSVLADSYRSTLYPGGILNDGFATGWVSEREDQAEPAGQPWAADRISGAATGDPDEACEANQELKLQAPPLVARFAQDLLYQADPGDDLAPANFVDEIQVPTFIAGAFQDEQTGGHWPTMLGDFDPEHLKRAVLMNGTHADALTPDVMRDLLDFLDLYVGRRTPQNPGILRSGAPHEFAEVFGADYAFPPWHGSIFGTHPDYVSQAAYEALPKVVLKWERGARDSTHCLVDRDPDPAKLDAQPCTEDGEGDGAPYARYETTYDAWPPPLLAEAGWFLGPDGLLSGQAPTAADGEPRGWSSFTYSTARDQVENFAGDSDDIWHKDATYDWDAPPEPDSLRFTTEPFTADRAFAGTGSVDLWVRAEDAASVDLEVTLTEVRRDGEETYVQSGWLRASHRAEAPGSTALAPVHPHLAAEDLPAGEFARVRVELFPFAHIVREGSRLAITVAGPGGNRPFWRFDADGTADGVTTDIGHSVGRPSRLTLPEVALPAGAGADDPPVCGDLRAQPCRTTPLSTRPTAVTASIDAGEAEDELDRGIEIDWTAPEAGGATGYEIGVLPSGEVEVDDDGQPGHRIAVPVEEPPPAGNPAYTVTATGVGSGLASNASAPVVPPHPFTDVPRHAWNVDAVDWVAAWRLADGFADGTFRNGANVTRGQFVRWLWTMFGRPTASQPHGFRDVAPGAWVSPALSWAKEEGIVSGFPGNRFAPRRQINRAQVAFWLWAASDRPGGHPAHGFGDIPASAWYAPAVDWARAEGVVAGFAGNVFRPQDNATRGQAATWFAATAAAFPA